MGAPASRRGPAVSEHGNDAMARSRLVEQIVGMSGAAFFVINEGPLRFQTPIVDALSHVPTEKLSQLIEALQRRVRDALSAIARLDAVQLDEWCLGDAVEEVREEGDVAQVGLVHTREYRLKRSPAPGLNGSGTASVGSQPPQVDGVAHHRVGEVPHDKFQIGGPAVVGGIDHGGAPGCSNVRMQP